MAREKKTSHKKRDGVVFSTNPDFEYEEISDNPFAALSTPTEGKQNLKVMLDKKQRGGKKVTLVTGFEGTEDDLKALGKKLKTSCGVGGAAKDGEIVVQGDFVAKVIELLKKEGYNAKRIGG